MKSQDWASSATTCWATRDPGTSKFQYIGGSEKVVQLGYLLLVAFAPFSAWRTYFERQTTKIIVVAVMAARVRMVWNRIHGVLGPWNSFLILSASASDS